MSTLRVIGVDPGPVPGFVVLTYAQRRLLSADVIQCTVEIAPRLFCGLLGQCRTLVGLEQFVVRGRARSTGKGGRQTRELIGALIQAAGDDVDPADWHTRAAGEVKPWATDTRLQAVGLLDLTKGMRHARDAARHALFCAVKDGGVPDPLSKRNGA